MEELMMQIEKKNLLKNDYEAHKTHSETDLKSTQKCTSQETKNVNFEKEKIAEIVIKLAQKDIKISPQKVRKYIFRELDTESIFKKITKAISQADEVRKKAEEEASRIWID
jgi:hypothetical protein